jgi:hypothetical protein
VITTTTREHDVVTSGWGSVVTRERRSRIEAYGKFDEQRERATLTFTRVFFAKSF